jgi:redox-sensing transcriptional repressor
VAIGIIATPATAAQEVCDRLVAAGVTSILNFAPAHLQVPPGVSLRKVDLSTELQILSFHEQRRAAVDLVRQVAARHRSADGAPPGQRPGTEPPCRSSSSGRTTAAHP